MDQFVNEIDTRYFQATNHVWNNSRFNTRWSVGTLTELIQQRGFHSKEEWELFYYESGRRRELEVQKLPLETQRQLNAKESDIYYPEKIRRLNTHYGRTPHLLKERAVQLSEAVRRDEVVIPIEICEQIVRYRIICDTWNGVIIRERRVIESLHQGLTYQGFLDLEFRKTEGTFDYRYEVDYELYIRGQRTLGIQIKPPSYLGNKPYLEEARQINIKKNRLYSEQFKIPVVYVYGNANGKLLFANRLYPLLQSLLQLTSAR